MRGNPVKLAEEFSKHFCLREAMDTAGYTGVGRIYEAVRDIEEHADIIRHSLERGMQYSHGDERLARIIREYERIAFSSDDEGIRVADKLKALDMYRALTDPRAVPKECSLVVNYDYGASEE